MVPTASTTTGPRFGGRVVRSLAYLALLGVVACQGEGVNNAPNPGGPKPVATPAIAAATPTPAEVNKPPSPAPSGLTSTASPTFAPTPKASETATPLSRPPSEQPTPLPSGFVSPLPRDAFPTDPPSVAPVGSPTPTPSPASPVPTPNIQDPVIKSNTLEFGTGSVAGFVFLSENPLSNPPKGIPQATIVIVSKADPSKKAELTAAGNGTYRLSSLAYGAYYVSVSKSGYVGDPRPTEVTIDASHSEIYTPFALLPQ